MPKWTNDQSAAIEAEGSAVLVSAAAGSGKTAVIVARVLRKLLDTENPMNIDELLLVTFTNAAAAEMRERISAAIAQEVNLRQDNVHLQRQLLLVQRAQIKTVHALCLQLVQENALHLGLGPDFRLMDERERNILFAEVLENTVEQAYEEADESFGKLIDLLLSGKDDKLLGKMVRHVYNKIQAQAWPDQTLVEMRELLYQGDMQTPTAAVLLTQAEDAASYGMKFLMRAITDMQGVAELQTTYLPTFESDLRQAEQLLNVLRQGEWDACVTLVQSIKPISLKGPRGFEDKDYLEQLKAWREEWKSALKKIKEKWLSIGAQDALWDRAHVAPALAKLTHLVQAFSDNMHAEKRKRSLLDFGDLEHYAIALLYDSTQPSTLARTLSGQYREIMVDEYQDTNAVQDAIFRALSHEERNLFMVGDVKQSIYGFRLADPSIFLAKYQSYTDANVAGQGQARRILLGQNFRSRMEVLDAANYVFQRTMGLRVGDLEYTSREALHLGASYPEVEDADYRTEILLLDTKNDDPDDMRDKVTLEATQVACRIRKLLDDKFPVMDRDTGLVRPVRAEDMVILLRAPSQKGKVYMDALGAVGITGSVDETGGLLRAVEVDTMVSMLMVLDNPRQDIPLIGVLRSPLYAISEEELAQIRLLDQKASFYDALCMAAQQESEKAMQFCMQFASFRMRAHDMPVFSLLAAIYEETSALALYGAQANGETRQANLLAFLERTRAFEAQGYRGLFAYVRLLRGMQENENDFARVVSKEQGGTVRIMSTHKSKGLEFPVVIVADIGKEFNIQDLKEPILVHSKLGLASKCKDLSRGLQYDTTERIALSLATRRELISEEMRILYVAMTRAKEKLILSASSARLTSWLKKWEMYASLTPIPQYAMGELKTALGWIMASVLRHPASRALRDEYELSVPEDMDAPDVFAVSFAKREGTREDPTLFLNMPDDMPDDEDMIQLPTSFVYPFASVTDLPSKVTATGLDRGDQAQEAAVWTGRKHKPESVLRTPVFVKQDRTLRPTEIGTAHHQFLQFCDFNTAQEVGGVALEIRRLRDKKMLSEEAADALDAKKLEAFFASQLYREQVATASVRREFKFSVLVPAVWAFPNSMANAEEEVLLQGVIDCLLETPEGFSVIDFKTDAVSGKAVQARAQSYRTQLDAYAMAIERIFGKPVKEKILYFLNTGNTVVFPA